MTLRRIVLLGAILALIVLSCGPSRPKSEREKPTKPTPPTLEGTISLELIPATEGGVYAVDSNDGGIWYVTGEKAVRVVGLEGAFIDSITPAAEGGVYLHVSNEGKQGLWYLKGDSVTKVQEVSSLPNIKPTAGTQRENWLWAMWQRERLKREQG